MNNLKSLQTRKLQLESELASCRDEISYRSKRESNIQQSLRHINEEMSKLTEKQPVVSEHATLRYLERVMGIDVEGVKKKMLSERNKKIIKTITSGKIPLKDSGFTLVVKDKVIVSVIEDK